MLMEMVIPFSCRRTACPCFDSENTLVLYKKNLPLFKKNKKYWVLWKRKFMIYCKIGTWKFHLLKRIGFFFFELNPSLASNVHLALCPRCHCGTLFCSTLPRAQRLSFCHPCWWGSLPTPHLSMRKEKEGFWMEKEWFSNFCCSTVILWTYYLDLLFWGSLLTLKFLSFSLLFTFLIFTCFLSHVSILEILWQSPRCISGCALSYELSLKKNKKWLFSPSWAWGMCMFCDCRGHEGAGPRSVAARSFVLILQSVAGLLVQTHIVFRFLSGSMFFPPRLCAGKQRT